MSIKKYSDEELIEIYNNLLDGRIRAFPPIFKGNKEYIGVISRYLFDQILKYDMSDIYVNVTEKFLIEYKMNNIVKRYFKSNYEYIKYIFPDEKVYVWKFTLGARHYLSDDSIIKEAAEYIIDKYNITIEDIYKGAITREIMTSEKMDSILTKRFNNSVFNMFEWYYREYHDIKLENHKYINKTSYFTEDTIIESVRRHFIGLGFDENDASLKNKRLLIKNFNDFEFNKICSKTTLYKFGKSFYDVFKTAFPNYDIYDWELLICSKGFWSKKSNRNDALLQLISRLDIQHDEIPKYINFFYLGENYSKFNSVCSKYYKSDYRLWVNDVFEGRFSKQEYYFDNIYHDSYKMESKQETYLHDILKSIFKDVTYIEKSDRDFWFYNEEYNESYCPDWICNKNIIVEFFGWYYPKNEHDMISNYTKKSQRKMEYYSSLRDYKTLYIFPEDINKSKEVLESYLLNIVDKKFKATA